MRKYGRGGFITLEDVRDKPICGTIVSVSEGQYGRPVLALSTGQKFTLNATNSDVLIDAYGPDDSDWISMIIEITAGEAKYKGEMQASAIVKPVTPGKPYDARAVPSEPPAAELDDEIPF
jgi:hypothetical protein